MPTAAALARAVQKIMTLTDPVEGPAITDGRILSGMVRWISCTVAVLFIAAPVWFGTFAHTTGSISPGIVPLADIVLCAIGIMWLYDELVRH